MTQLPTIALTMGDPAGVGPEVVLKALADPALAGMAHWVVLGDGRVMEMAQGITGLRL
jgi:4-hydroxy-L-threonine phosphate dehydrogenase PdxA